MVNTCFVRDLQLILVLVSVRACFATEHLLRHYHRPDPRNWIPNHSVLCVYGAWFLRRHLHFLTSRSGRWRLHSVHAMLGHLRNRHSNQNVHTTVASVRRPELQLSWPCADLVHQAVMRVACERQLLELEWLFGSLRHRHPDPHLHQSGSCQQRQ